MTLAGMDIASYQASLNLGSVGGDFVVIKATEGVSYVNPYCDTHYQQAKAANKLRGVYHFARNRSNSAVAEAKHFVGNIRGYIKDALLVLDWEDGSGVSDVAWATAWLDTVTQLTGVRPLIYMSASPASQYAWETVSRDYGLWIAGYPTSTVRGLETPDCPYRPGHNWNVVMWQYTSSGRIAGYNGALDLNVFYGDQAAWHKYAGATTASTITTPTDLEEVIATMNATHVIFSHKGTIFIADILAGTYRPVKDEETFIDTKTVLGRTGAKVKHWSQFAASKSDEVANPAAFGVRVG